MSVYDEISDLYNFDQVEAFNPDLYKATFIIENESYKGNTFYTPKGSYVFVYRTNGTMGNHWYLYDINNGKHLLTGRRTKKQIIEESGSL
jgi:hypothetical protein